MFFMGVFSVISKRHMVPFKKRHSLNTIKNKNTINSFVSRVGVVVVVVVGRLVYDGGRRSCCSGPFDHGDNG